MASIYEDVSLAPPLFERKRNHIEDLINFIGDEFGVTKEEMIGVNQRRTVAKARSVFCYLGSRELGITGESCLRR